MSAMSNKDIDEKNRGELLWQWAEKYADIKARLREVIKELQASQDTKVIERLKMEKRVLVARIKAIRKKRNGLVDEIIHNNEEKPYRSEVEDDPALQAKRQEEFSN